MPLKKPIHEGRSYVVRFTTDLNSQGPSLVSVGWVPKHGAAVPDDQIRLVAPGTSIEVTGTVEPFAEAHRMEVIVDVDDAGSGRLEILEGGRAHVAGSITSDTTWKMLVEKK